MLKRALRKSPPPLYIHLWDTWSKQSDQLHVEVDWEQVVREVRRKPRVTRYQDEQRRGMLLLHLVCALYPTAEAVRAIIEANPAATSHVGSTGLIPLHIAAGRNASVDVLRILLRHDAKSIDVQDNNGQTPIHYACRQDVDKSVLHLLLLMKPDLARDTTIPHLINNANRQRSPSALEILYQEHGESSSEFDPWSDNQWSKIAKLVVTAHYGTLPVARNAQTFPILHAVLARNCPQKVLEVAANRFGRQLSGMADRFGNLPLHYAVSSKYANQAIVTSLLSFYPHGAATRNGKGQLPLHQAVKHDCIGSIEELLRRFPAAVQERDRDTKLPVALLGAERANVPSTYLLLREYPQIVPTQ